MADLTSFAFATVMDIYGLKESNISAKLDPLVEAVGLGTVDDSAYDFKLDSLTISNITQEGPTKEARGGIHNKPLIRHKKTMRLEMEDVVARVETLEHFFGAIVNGTEQVLNFIYGQIHSVALVGRTYVVIKRLEKMSGLQ